MTYSLDFRTKVLSVRAKEHLTIEEVSRRFDVGVASVTRWLKRLEPMRTRYKSTKTVDRIALAKDIREYPDAYHFERAERLSCSASGIYHALKRMGITYKKNSISPKGERRRTACLPCTD